LFKRIEIVVCFHWVNIKELKNINTNKRLLVSINGADKFVNGSYDIKMVDQMQIHSASSRIERFQANIGLLIFS
jgi:hypothetical protein